MKILPIAVLLATALQAQINWTSPADLPVADTILTGGGTAQLCRAQIGGLPYLGSAIQGACTGNFNGAFIQSTVYEVARGLGHWDQTQPPNQPAFVGAFQSTTALYACRAVLGDTLFAGYRPAGQNVCKLAIGGQAKDVDSFETLYALNTADTFRLLTSSGMCIISSLLQTAAPPQQIGCNALGGQDFELVNLGNNLFNLRNPAVSLCLSSDGPADTKLAACGEAPAALRFSYADAGESVRIRFNATGKFLEIPLGFNLPNTRLVQNANAVDAGQRFRLRTVSDFARRLNVMTYNVMMLEKMAFPGLRQAERSIWLPDAIALADPGLDVIAFQETFDATWTAMEDRLAEHGFTYVSKVPAGGDNLTNGGARIVSRWPIEETGEEHFTDCAGASSDCLAAKGVSYARINKAGRVYHVFTTHLQADEGGNDYWSTRARQLVQMRAFISRKVGPGGNGQPVIVTGDMDIDMESRPADYNAMLQTLGATFFRAPRPAGVWAGNSPYRWTANAQTNDIKKLRGGSSSFLDYLLMTAPGPNPVSARYEVKEYEKSSSYWMIVAFWGFGLSSQVNDLSDHSALLGNFVFAYPPAGPATVTTTRVLFESSALSGIPSGAGVVVDGQRYLLPVSLDLANEVEHSVTADEYVPITAGDRWAFQSWSGSPGKQLTWTLNIPRDGKSFRVVYDRQFRLIAESNVNLGGTVTGAGWYSDRNVATVNATAAAGFTFNGLSGAITSPTAPVSFEMNGPKTVIANFTSNGRPVLHAQSGVRQKLTDPLVNVDLFLRNAGLFPATNARITGFGAITVQLGSGVVQNTTPLPVSVGTVLPGSAVGVTLTLNWPGSAFRIALPVQFAADGGVTGQTVLYLNR